MIGNYMGGMGGLAERLGPEKPIDHVHRVWEEDGYWNVRRNDGMVVQFRTYGAALGIAQREDRELAA